MKINRWIAQGMIALLVVGAVGFVGYRVFASQGTQTTGCSSEVEETDANESAQGEDLDSEECGNQADDEVNAADANESVESNGQDQSDGIAPASISISAEQAQQIAEAANPGAATLNVEFDREGGKDIWEVELNNGLDVKVDANSGDILLTEQRD